jgi:hypothetical protein
MAIRLISSELIQQQAIQHLTSMYIGGEPGVLKLPHNLSRLLVGDDDLKRLIDAVKSKGNGYLTKLNGWCDGRRWRKSMLSRFACAHRPHVV